MVRKNNTPQATIFQFILITITVYDKKLKATAIDLL
jgi:hypothetical protein